MEMEKYSITLLDYTDEGGKIVQEIKK